MEKKCLIDLATGAFELDLEVNSRMYMSAEVSCKYWLDQVLIVDFEHLLLNCSIFVSGIYVFIYVWFNKFTDLV